MSYKLAIYMWNNSEIKSNLQYSARGKKKCKLNFQKKKTSVLKQLTLDPHIVKEWLIKGD